jgi:hypothetical protein
MSACLKVSVLSPRSVAIRKSKKNRFEPEKRPIKPCKIVAKNEIAAILKPIVAVAGRR